MNTEARALAEAMYEASTNADEATIMKAAELYTLASPASIEWAERYVRSCLVAQGLAA